MRLTIDADPKQVLKALSRLEVSLEKELKAVAKVTAEAIASEARGRVKRRTGETARGITVQEARSGSGYVVLVEQPENPTLDVWLEFGTKHMMAAPFLFASARLEEGPHMRRVIEAINDAIEEASR